LAFAFLMMGGFVAVYNYLTFHLSRPPYSLPGALLGLVFLAYLGGTVASPVAGRLAGAHGRLPVMLGGMAVMAAGLLATLAGPLPLLLIGLVVMTGGFFGAHAVASGWAGARSAGAGSQATGLYNLAYYAGSSVLGWGVGLVYEAWGWGATVAVVLAVIAAAAALVLLALRGQDEQGGRSGSEGSVGQIEHPHREGQGGHADQDDPDQVQPDPGPGHLRDAHVPGAVGDGIGRGRDR